MEGAVIPAHRPDDADEAHQHGDAGRERCALVDGAPDLTRRGEFGEPALFAVGAGGDQNDDYDEGNEVEGGAAGVDLG